MSKVRRRRWQTSAGEQRESWLVDYSDASGRHVKTFERKRDAEDFRARVHVDIGAGIHSSGKMTVAEAAQIWLDDAHHRLTRTTVTLYGQWVRDHINPFIGATRLSALTLPAVHEFADALRDAGRSHRTVKTVVQALGAILAEAQARGKVGQNVVRSMRPRRGTKATQRRRLQVGIDIPTPAEIRSLVNSIDGHWRPFAVTAVFTGLRSSELRGLCWDAVDLRAGVVHVRRRADRYGGIDKPKSEAGERAVPLPPLALTTLREWRLRCPRSDLGLTFPTRSGRVQDRANIVRALNAAWVAAGVVAPDGGPKYSGLHCFRHFFASWCINRQQDGGLGLPPKTVQHRLGHSTLAMTMDTYAHLFPAGDDAEELARAEKLLLS